MVQKTAKKTGFRARIDAKCKECIYDPTQAGSWRKQVENCTSYQCPLFDVRPKAKPDSLTKLNRSEMDQVVA